MNEGNSHTVWSRFSPSMCILSPLHVENNASRKVYSVAVGLKLHFPRALPISACSWATYIPRLWTRGQTSCTFATLAVRTHQGLSEPLLAGPSSEACSVIDPTVRRRGAGVRIASAVQSASRLLATIRCPPSQKLTLGSVPIVRAF